MVDVDGLIRRARDSLASARPVTKQLMLGGELVGVRFAPIGGDEWRELTARHLPREGSYFDQNLGYNVDAVTRDYPRFSIVSGDDVDDLHRDEGRYIWPDVYALLDAPALEILAQSLWETHQLDPQRRLVEAGKALRGGRASTPSSPENSA